MLFPKVNRIAAQLFCIALVCFVFFSHSTHGSTTKTAVFSVAPSNVITSAINNSTTSDMVLSTNTSSPYTTIAGVNITSTPVMVSTSVVAPTDKPAKPTAKHCSEDTGRKFDGLSFFGGMILGAVVCVILLFSVKYYQAKKRSYHSL